MKRKVQLQFALDYQKPMEVRATVAELKAQATAADWACLESLALEVLRQSSVDLATVMAVASLGAEAPVLPE